MNSNDTARAMIEQYIKVGASKVEQERQWREVAAGIQGTDRGAVEGFPRRPSGVTASRPMDGILIRRNQTKNSNTKW